MRWWLLMLIPRIALAFVIGLLIGFWTGATWDRPHDSEPTGGYSQTQHIKTYYGLLRVHHIPEPKDWVRGFAGQDYCKNLVGWYVTVHLHIINGENRKAIARTYRDDMHYEVVHGWLSDNDRDQLLLYIVVAPLVGRNVEELRDMVTFICEQRKNPPL